MAGVPLSSSALMRLDLATSLESILLVAGPFWTLVLLGLIVFRYRQRLLGVKSASQRELNAYERKLSTLLANMPGIAYRCHNDGRDWVMRYISQGAETLTGYSVEELLGEAPPVFGDLIHPDDRELVKREVESGTRNGQRFHMRYRIVDKTGNEHWVWEQGVLVDPDLNGGMLEGFICDVTEQKRLEEEKEAAFQKLERAMSEIKRLQGIIPICSSCKKIRNGDGGWEQLEAYIRQHSDANFSHGICPDCARELYPDLGKRCKGSGNAKTSGT